MSTITIDNKLDVRNLVEDNFARKKIIAFGAPLLIVAYFIYIAISFDFAGISERAKLDKAATLLADTYSYKTHVLKSNRGAGDFSIAIEGEKKGRYKKGVTPDWVTINGDNATVSLAPGHAIEFVGKTVYYDIPNYGLVEVQPKRSGVDLKLPSEDIPDFINASKTRVTITTDAGRVSVTKTKTQVFRYFFGWEMFFFTLDSPFYDMSFTEIVGSAFSSDQIDPVRSNASAIWNDFWYNPMWRHSDVAWALFETILMAFLGTVGGALIALPLAFMAAKNFSPIWLTRFSLRRIFDFLRGVDGLIWTIILSRAFGPGPLTGALAILLTDTGTFGKMFSESLENVDEKQIEGIRSTGAKPLQRYRFGVIPQLIPVFLSQILYYLESNTRSATVIGAIVGGGIGLQLTQAIITGKDWEEVSYYIILIILMVMMMDTISGWLRRKLIGGKG
ncbi:phosphonate ABC transporter, permease protein PhnE [Lentilitoribacter sp. Alg239-R112]|uniref:phosphonate ABC transporter, permease protein PhnE n=1 Tax=Lentilitoribacter sp. Alg239-R112 TaxID=2305987 RepID=UPI0013A6EE97|nr:phosphonate ABC transporter, permease protein PhnE [Lentilitoribacter sp. Alg239-R112]